MDLRNDMRQKNTQITLDFHSEPTGEARQARGEASESLPTMRAPESPASTNPLMEEVCEGENLKQALQQVKTNKGSPGIDGMTVEELPGYVQQHWPVIREQLLNGTYEPKPVRRVEIEKPDGGGMRKLGIPPRWFHNAPPQSRFRMLSEVTAVQIGLGRAQVGLKTKW